MTEKTLITESEFFALIKAGIKDFSGYKLAEGLAELYCYNSQLTALPELPEGLIELHCGNNSLAALPGLPEKLIRLYCDNNQLMALPELPEGLVYLTCSYNALTALPKRGYGIFNYTISETSGRSVWFDKKRNRILTGCFCDTPEAFLEKGFVQEKKQWVQDFYNRIKTL